jgi:hypothetical protein
LRFGLISAALLIFIIALTRALTFGSIANRLAFAIRANWATIMSYLFNWDRASASRRLGENHVAWFGASNSGVRHASRDHLGARGEQQLGQRAHGRIQGE